MEDMVVQEDKVEQFGIIAHNLCGEVEAMSNLTNITKELKAVLVSSAEMSFEMASKMDSTTEDALIALAVIAMSGYKLYTGLDANKIANLMTDTYRRKNADYGNSFDESVDKFGLVSAIVRMSDKVNRLKSLVIQKNEVQVKDESIADTFLDLASYAIMTIMYIKKNKI